MNAQDSNFPLSWCVDLQIRSKRGKIAEFRGSYTVHQGLVDARKFPDLKNPHKFFTIGYTNKEVEVKIT